MNTQPISKSNHTPDGPVLVHSIFYTIQGEGPFAGRPAVFVRLAGCNLQCPACDTEYTGGELLSPEQVIDRVHAMTTQRTLVVISGGEPFRQNIGPLVARLSRGFDVQIETNGTLYLPGFPYDQATIVCSPKAGVIQRKLQPYIDALKYVLHADSIRPEDGLPIRALGHTAVPYVARPTAAMERLKTIYVQPIDENESENPRHLAATIKSAQDHGYTLCLQLHKIIGME